MAYKKKYCKGAKIESLDELAEQEFVYCHNKILHCGWFMSWQFGLAKRFLERGYLYRAERVSETPVESTFSKTMRQFVDEQVLAASMVFLEKQLPPKKEMGGKIVWRTFKDINQCPVCGEMTKNISGVRVCPKCGRGYELVVNTDKPDGVE